MDTTGTLATTEQIGIIGGRYGQVVIVAAVARNPYSVIIFTGVTFVARTLFFFVRSPLPHPHPNPSGDYYTGTPKRLLSVCLAIPSNSAADLWLPLVRFMAEEVR